MAESTFWDRTRFFTPGEFNTKDASGKPVPLTGERNMKEKFISLLDRLRYIYDLPLSPSSGYRSPEHNAEVSHTGEGGPHTFGQAADFPADGHNLHALIHAAVLTAVVEAGYLNEQEAKACLKEIREKELGFTGLGVAKTFLHLDNVTAKDDQKFAVRPNVWTY